MVRRRRHWRHRCVPQFTTADIRSSCAVCLLIATRDWTASGEPLCRQHADSAVSCCSRCSYCRRRPLSLRACVCGVRLTLAVYGRTDELRSEWADDWTISQQRWALSSRAAPEPSLSDVKEPQPTHLSVTSLIWGTSYSRPRLVLDSHADVVMIAGSHDSKKILGFNVIHLIHLFVFFSFPHFFSHYFTPLSDQNLI